VFELNQAIFKASHDDAGAISIVRFSKVAHAAGGRAAGRPRTDAGDDTEKSFSPSW
jgi:hypothetical protein